MAQLSLFLVVLLALVIPIFMARFQISNVPTAVAEIIVGIVMGSSGFNLITSTHDLTFLSNLGVILLMFLSGMEIDFDLLQRKNNPKGKSQAGKTVDPLKTAITAFIGIVVMAFVLAYILRLTGLFSEVMLAAIILMTVALGVVIATLKEKDILGRPIGQTILLTAVLGEVIPLLLLTIYASVNGGNAEQLWLIILLFAAAIFLLRRFKQPYLWFAKITKATTQLDIRLAFFLIFALVTVAERVGAENILGAFLAGMVMKLLEPSEATKDKLTSIGYGFFIPIFFIMTGVGLNLRSLFAHPSSLMLLPVLVIFLFIAKAPVVLTYMRYFQKKNAFAGGFLTATTITIVLPTLQVARKLHAITSTQSDAFILAAVIVCILSPIVFNSNFVLLPEDKIKEKVAIVGANAVTVPVAHDLHANWYSVKMFTDKKNQYKTYDSRVENLTFLPNLDEETLEKGGVFDGDIVVAANRADEDNIKIARMAKEKGVNRVIARLSEVDSKTLTEFNEKGIEVFNSTNVHAALMRAMIESPTVYRIMTDTKNILYSVKVKNTHYTGRQLMDLEFIDQITVSRIKRGDEWLIPRGATEIEPGDILVFSGEFKVADRVRDLLSKE
ncbi:monovalent cation:proton antiporter family protein [Lactobacillus helveticus]|jgi:monovalent cation:H+ antiporter-2, CPA2 family|uniref:Periplasmic nitrate reductase NapA n=2 Tax=Lactobacillus helveticus TaxID=1587 RepID=U4QMC9_LACHE|nr:cation:proton antiporter family protein [Lactobacillus helveticus]AFR21229.1 Periplasmic nitrate reductase NapA [Lactobacillus helveticus R0052]AZK91935.1 Glutathione-regulated potassium-efflux system protein KefC [Lactobacillus helveticus]MCJ2190574.1 cation:proton antiporter [Lactobacillus helveticus]MED7628612.1 potassium transporter [Lactobacillus helveticus]MZR06141.1 potassium transporter [Lactobacillus helveticus]